MTLSSDNTQVFIVRIWLERREIEGAPPEWRGTIEHVPSGKRHSFRDLNEILIFVIPYLEQLGIAPKLSWRLKRWLRWKG